jgi:hypothetical protein
VAPRWCDVRDRIDMDARCWHRRCSRFLPPSKSNRRTALLPSVNQRSR